MYWQTNITLLKLIKIKCVKNDDTHSIETYNVINDKQFLYRNAQCILYANNKGSKLLKMKLL